MKKTLAFCVIALFVILLVSCTSASPPPEASPLPYPPPSVLSEVEPEDNAADEEDEPLLEEPSPFANLPHGELAIQHITFLNDYLPERIAFSYRELEAAEWIADELLAMGHPQAEIEMQTFTTEAAQLSPWAWSPLHFFDIGNHELREYSQNVLLTIPGQSEQRIVVGAHYDTLLYPGASDNASGVGLLLESAHRMRYLDHYYTIVYVFFGAEEVWWLGAYYYLDQLSEEERDQIVLMINADVLLDGDMLIYAAGYGTDRNAPNQNALTTRLDQIADGLNAAYDMGLAAMPQGLRLNSDHAPFFYAGHTVLFLFGSTYSEGIFYLDVLHSDRDNIHYIQTNMPGRTERAMSAFSVFLEDILLLRE